MQIRTGLYSQLAEVNSNKHLPKKGQSGPGMLQDQFCASWDWQQVENSSEQSSVLQSSHA